MNLLLMGFGHLEVELLLLGVCFRSEEGMHVRNCLQSFKVIPAKLSIYLLNNHVTKTET